MKVGIISDSHDNIPNLNKALDFFNKEKVSEVIHCGDLCAPFMVEELAKFKGNKHIISGNTCDNYTTSGLSLKHNVSFYGDFAEVVIDGKKVAIVHYPFLAEGLASSGKYDAVFYGHNHSAKSEKKGNTFLVNPGEIMGRKNKPSCAIWDINKNEVKLVEL